VSAFDQTPSPVSADVLYGGPLLAAICQRKARYKYKEFQKLSRKDFEPKKDDFSDLGVTRNVRKTSV